MVKYNYYSKEIYDKIKKAAINNDCFSDIDICIFIRTYPFQHNFVE